MTTAESTIRMPAISVLIPVRNAAATVDQALGSIKAQTFTDWEAIVVDDGSTDDTRRLLRAISEASAPVLARMDADDVSLPKRLERQMERLAQGDAAAVGCQVRYFP